MSRLSLLRDLLEFLMERKKLWLFPVILVLLGLGLLIVLSSSSALAPFIYALF